MLRRFASSLPLIIGFVAMIWAVELVNSTINHQLNVWGITPRSLHGLVGILVSPFLHSGFNHVMSNTIVFLSLGSLMALRGKDVLLRVSVFIILIGGVGVWALGRPAIHVGASGLVFGYFGYLVSVGWYERKLLSIAISVLVIIFYGGLIGGVLPSPGFVSWEAHLFGLIAGVLAARNRRH